MVRRIDHPAMTIAVDLGYKATKQIKKSDFLARWLQYMLKEISMEACTSELILRHESLILHIVSFSCGL